MTVSTTNEVVLDSLPYIERIHNDYEEYALALIEEEMNQQIQIRSDLTKPMEPIKFRTLLMEKEYKTLIKKGGDGGGADTEFVVPRSQQDGGGSSFFAPPKIARPSSIEEWTSHAIPTAKQRYEAERIRSIVLEAQKECSVADWKMYNTALDGIKNSLQAYLQTTTENVEEINYQRQKVQTDSFLPQLDELTVQHQQMVYRRNQLVHSIEGMKRQQN